MTKFPICQKTKKEGGAKGREEHTSAALAAALIASGLSPLSFTPSPPPSVWPPPPPPAPAPPPPLLLIFCGTGARGFWFWFVDADADAEPSVRPGREKGSVVGFEGGEVEEEGLPQRLPIFFCCVGSVVSGEWRWGREG